MEVVWCGDRSAPTHGYLFVQPERPMPRSLRRAGWSGRLARAIALSERPLTARELSEVVGCGAQRAAELLAQMVKRGTHGITRHKVEGLYRYQFTPRHSPSVEK